MEKVMSTFCDLNNNLLRLATDKILEEWKGCRVIQNYIYVGKLLWPACDSFFPLIFKLHHKIDNLKICSHSDRIPHERIIYVQLFEV